MTKKVENSKIFSFDYSIATNYKMFIMFFFLHSDDQEDVMFIMFFFLHFSLFLLHSDDKEGGECQDRLPGLLPPEGEDEDGGAGPG